MTTIPEYTTPEPTATACILRAEHSVTQSGQCVLCQCQLWDLKIWLLIENLDFWYFLKLLAMFQAPKTNALFQIPSNDNR